MFFRNCIGQNFAMHEMKVIIGRILRKWVYWKTYNMFLTENSVFHQKKLSVFNKCICFALINKIVSPTPVYLFCKHLVEYCEFYATWYLIILLLHNVHSFMHIQAMICILLLRLSGIFVLHVFVISGFTLRLTHRVQLNMNWWSWWKQKMECSFRPHPESKLTIKDKL